MKYHLVQQMLILLGKSDGLWGRGGGSAAVGSVCQNNACVLVLHSENNAFMKGVRPRSTKM